MDSLRIGKNHSELIYNGFDSGNAHQGICKDLSGLLSIRNAISENDHSSLRRLSSLRDLYVNQKYSDHPADKLHLTNKSANFLSDMGFKNAYVSDDLKLLRNECERNIPYLACSSTTTTSDSEAGSCSSSCKSAGEQDLIQNRSDNYENTSDKNNCSDKDRGANHLQRKQLVRDDAYWERRRKNNDAAKRSRDQRRRREDEMAIRAVVLERENVNLKQEVGRLRSEIDLHRVAVLNGPFMAQIKLKNNMIHQNFSPATSLALNIAAVAAAAVANGIHGDSDDVVG